MTEEQKARITEYASSINTTASEESYSDILSFVIDEVADRALIYLNRTDMPVQIERIIARVVSGIFNQTINSVSSTEADQAINSMSDNGQSISFSNEAKNYLATTQDNELFAGYSALLARYRRINVVSRESQKSNC